MTTARTAPPVSHSGILTPCAAAVSDAAPLRYSGRWPLPLALTLLLLSMPVAARSAQLIAENTSIPLQRLRQLSLQQLGNVQVTTYNKTPTELWNTPAAVCVLTSQEILRSGATSIADALRLVPGVEVGRIASNAWAIGIRGLQNNFSKSVLVLVDGRSVYTPLFAGTYWDVLDLPLRDVDHIEVIRGPGGTIWGPNAANGVINIITKPASDTRGVSADALLGNEDRTIDDFQIGASSHDIGFRLFGRGFERAAEYHSDGINDDAWHQDRVGFRAGQDNGPDTWFLEGQSYRGDSPRILGTTPYDDETSGGDLNFRWERNLPSGNGLYLQAYFDRTLRTNDPIGETRNTIDVDFLQHFHLPHNQQFSYGGGLRWSPYHILGAIPTDTILPAENTDHIFTAFAQDEIQLRSNLQVTGGLKLEENNYSGVDLQPSGRLLWLVRPHQVLWAGVTRAVTTPSDLEEGQYIHAGGPGFYVQLTGNHNFKSEDIVGYEAGYRGLFASRFYCDFSTFWNQYSNLQSFSAPAFTISGGVITEALQYTNQIQGSTSGFEIGPQVVIVPGWRLNLGYSFLNSDFSANGATSNISSSGSVTTYEHSTPRHMVTAQSLIDLPYRIEFDQTFRYVSVLPAQKVPAYETADLHLSKEIGRNFVLEAVGQNLFQPRHVEWGTGDPSQPDVGIERAAYAQLTFRPAP
ncbi:MAG TPA: TonB-dependent receptor [Acidobacteriaceae bacterium]|nr:TonB-dependent receptor [Acidobacteriaceae bacterium]